MKLTVGAFSLLFAAGAAMAGTDFPYADSLTQRYSLTGPTTISSFETETPVPPVVEGGGMQASEHVAVITAEVANFTASDPDDWAECIGSDSLAGLQASLSMTYNEKDELSWMGYTKNGWVPLTGAGVTPSEGAWSVKIEIDYSVPTKAVRYSVKASGESNYTVLKADSCEWLQLGGNVAKVNDIGLLGYGTVSSVSGDCAARPFDGKVTTTESFNMQYEKLKVNVSATGAWGDTAKVTLKKDGVPVENAVVYGAVTDGACNFEADFTGKTVVGEDYTYDVEFLKGGESGTKIGQADTSEKSVKLYSEIEWFGFKDGAFEKATAEDIAINETTGTFASKDDETVGNINPQKVSDDGAQTTVKTEVIVAGVSPINELPTEDGQQFAVSLATDNGIRKWAYRVGSGDWEKSDATVATENGTYEVKVTFDYRDGNKTGTCWVKPEGGDYVALVTDFTLGTANKLAGTSVLGGDVGYMNASFKTVSPAPVVPKDGKIETNGSNVKFDLEQATAGAYTVDKTRGGSLSWKDADGKYATLDGSDLTVKTGTPANGLSSYESYLLGLNTEVATSKPLVGTEQVTDAAKIKFVLSGVNPKPESETGVAVSYELIEQATPTATTADKITPFTDTVTVDLPASGAKYYKVNIKTTK